MRGERWAGAVDSAACHPRPGPGEWFAIAEQTLPAGAVLALFER
ncbi:hypothetical protein [Geodermatophilus normandii]|nr:hypothetical protein [Geodermatophilus normandii]